MRVAADANVLLSALIGGRAARILRHPSIDEVLTTEFTLGEVQEYAGRLAVKKGLSLDLILMGAATLPVTSVERVTYRSSLAEARRRIGRRDPDDVDLLALALHYKIPVWSNDNDFKEAGIKLFTTASLLAVIDR